MTAFTVASTKDFVVGIAAVLVALGAIGRYVVRPIFRYFQRVEHAVKATEAEVRPNGGSSMRDAIDRIDIAVSAHESRMVAMERAVESMPGLVSAVAALEAKLREPVVSSTTTTTKVKTVEPAHIEPETT
jgi:hypothetical protein